MSRPLYIVWNDKNILGIPIIDEQHRGMVVLINSFHYSLEKGYKIEKLRPFRSLLDGYVKIHFQTEEALMIETEYPELEDHNMKHKELDKKINKIAEEALRSGNPDVALKFLKEWWIDHINVTDRKFSLYLKSKEKI